MAKEFTQSVAVDGKLAPPVGDLGRSEISYGNQRQGDDSTADVYVDPGTEGAKAVKFQIGNGGISSQEQNQGVDG